MSPLELVLLVTGGVLLLAAVGCYLKDTARVAFPIVLALLGAFLLAADEVSASLPGGGSVKLAKEVAEKSSEAADALLAASQKNSEAITAISTALTDSQNAFADYRNEVNERFAALNEQPVAAPNGQLEQSRAAVQTKIREANSANNAAKVQSKALRDLSGGFTVKQ